MAKKYRTEQDDQVGLVFFDKDEKIIAIVSGCAPEFRAGAEAIPITTEALKVALDAMAEVQNWLNNGLTYDSIKNSQIAAYTKVLEAIAELTKGEIKDRLPEDTTKRT